MSDHDMARGANRPPPGKGLRGRGAAGNPPNRFEGWSREPDPDYFDPDAAPPREPTVFYDDESKSILSRNDSPDVPFTYSVNPYRGCEHGCVYCYARPTHEYLGFSAGLDFETRIMVKRDAPALLRAAFEHPKWEPQTVALSGNTDCYQPAEKRLGITRGLLEVFAAFRNPVAIITKNRLVTRDLDLLGELAAVGAVSVSVSVTTLDQGLNRVLEPRTSLPRQRLDTIARLAEAGVPVGVMVAPVIPGLTDHEIPAILSAAAEAGATDAGYVMLRLPHAVAPLFEDWLGRHVPDRREKVLNRIREMRCGALYDARFGTRHRGEGAFAEQARRLFEVGRRKAGLASRGHGLRVDAFRRPGGEQLGLFG